MVDADPIWDQVLQILGDCELLLHDDLQKDFLAFAVFLNKCAQLVLGKRHIPDDFGSSGSLFP